MESKQKVYEANGLSADEFIGTVQSSLMKVFDKTRFEFNGTNMNSRLFSGRVKTKLFNPIVSLRGILTVKCSETTCAANIEYDTKTNGWFWFTFLIGFFFWPLWVLMVWMWMSQKRRTVEALDMTLNSVEYDLVE